MFFRPDSGPPPPPPSTYASTAKKGEFIGTSHFFSIAWPFEKKGRGLVLVYVLFQHLSLRSNPKHGWFTRKFANHIWPPGSYELSWLCPLKPRARGGKFIRTGGFQMWFANFHVNQPCFRLDCRERCWLFSNLECNDFEKNQGAPKVRRRRRAEKQLSKRVFLESPFLLCPLKVCSYNTWKVLKTLREQRRNGLFKNTLLDNRFSARCLRCSFGAPPKEW